jgi:hypothetical protein
VGTAIAMPTSSADLRLCFTRKLGIVIAKNVAISLTNQRKNRRLQMTREQAFRMIEEHIEALANYDVITADVAETLTAYIFKFMLEIDSLEDEEELGVDNEAEIANVISLWSKHLDEITKEPNDTNQTSQKDENDEETN